MKLKKGDFIINEVGEKAKVLAVLGDVFLKSSWNNSTSSGMWCTFVEAENFGWKLYDKKPKPMTKKEIEAALGYPIEIKK